MDPGAGRLDQDRAPAIQAIGRLNRTVSARARQGHTARGICAALAAGAATVALAVLDGHPLEDAGLYVLMAVVAALTFTAWRGAHRVSADAVAARVDEGLGLRGAYVAAVEAGDVGRPSVMAELGAERVAAEVRRGAAMEAAVPHSAAFVALPLLASALLVAAVGVQDSKEMGARGERARSFAISNDLNALARDGALPMDEAAREAIQRAAEAAAAAGAASGGRQREMREIADELEALAQQAPPGSDLAEALGRAAAAAEAVALEAGPDAGSEGGSEVGSAEPAESDPADEAAPADRRGDLAGGESEEPGDRRGEGGDGERSGDVTSAAGGGADPAADPATAVGDPAPGSGSEAPAASGPGVSGPAPGGADPVPQVPTRSTRRPRWWDARDAGIVSRWVARKRTGAGSGSDGQ